MDTERLRRCKHPKKMKTSSDDGKAEVYVLPPDLLKKLAIRLGNASDGTHSSSTDVTVAGAEIENESINNYSKPDVSERTDDASMLETADLMKKSVFLSPTFVSTVANVFPGEMEIASVKEPDTPNMITQAVDSNIFAVDNREINIRSVTEPATATVKSLTVNPTTHGVFITVTNNEHNNSTQINDSAFDNIKDITPSDNNKNITDSSLTSIANINLISNTLNNHVAENQLMNHDNDNSKHTLQSSEVIHQQAENIVSKINIISEEIIGPSKLKGLKILPNITALTPVTIDTKIGININDTALKSFKNSPTYKECKQYTNEVLNSDENLTKRKSTEIRPIEVNTINGEVTQHLPENNTYAVTHDIRNNNSPPIYNIVNPKVQSITNSDCNSNSNVYVSHVENNTVNNGNNFDKLSSEVANIHVTENNVCSDLNMTGITSLQNKTLTTEVIIDRNVYRKAENVIKTTLNVKKDASRVDVLSKNDFIGKNHLSRDSNNIDGVQNFRKPSYTNSQQYNNDKGGNQGSHDPNRNNEKELAHHESFVEKSTCRVLYSNKDNVLMVEENTIKRQEKVVLDIPNTDRCLTSPDTLPDKEVLLVTRLLQDSKEYKINNQGIHEKLGGSNLVYKDDEMHIETNKNIVINGTEVSDNNDDYTNNSGDLVNKGCIISTLNNSTHTETFYARDVNKHRNIDLEIQRNKNFVEHSKELDSGKVLSQNNNHHPINISMQTIENDDFNKSNYLVDIPTGEVHQNQKYNILKTNDNSINSNIDAQEEKVKEIAEYLKTLTHIRSGKTKLENKKIISNNNKNKSVEMNPNKIKSKSSIQGVEKPGGINIENGSQFDALKTYRRQNRLRNTLFTTNPQPNKCHSSECAVTDVNTETINTAVLAANIKTQEFCLCNDFGRLDYYDGDDLYEHIHFCQHRDTNCDLDLILNIYNDNVNSDQNEINNDYILEEDNETVEFNICWNAFPHRDQEYYIEKALVDEVTNINHEHIYDKVVSASHENGCKPVLINPVKENIVIASLVDSDNQNLDSIHLEEGDAIADSRAGIRESYLKNNKDSVVFPNETKYNSQLVNIENLDKVSNTDNVPQTSTKNIDHDMDCDGDSVIDDDSLRTESIIKDGKETDDEHFVSTMDNESTDDEEETLSVIKNNKNIPNLKERKMIQTVVSNTNVKTGRKRRERTDEPYTKSKKASRRDHGSRQIECAVCHELFSEKKWDSHVIGDHQFIAWRAGETFDLDDADLQRKLKQSLKMVGYLKCTFCNLEMYILKKFMQHIRICMKLKDYSTGQGSEAAATSTQSNVICGVCKTEVQYSMWFEHIGKNHKYLAWIDGLDPVKLDDAHAVREHLMKTMKQAKEFSCYKCGVSYKLVKKYLSHVETCDADELNIPSTSYEEQQHIKCGVCKQVVSGLGWVGHIATEHNYLAWQDDRPALMLDDEGAVWEHLQQFVRFHGGLTCHKCGLNRKRVKLYLDHIKTCDGTVDYFNISTASYDCNTTNEPEEEGPENVKEDFIEDPTLKEFVKCGVCKEKISGSTWMKHVVEEHDYMAWEHGSRVNVKNRKALRVHLQKILEKLDELVCKKCGASCKTVECYMEHKKDCYNETLDNSKLETIDDNTTAVVVCGVCKAEVKKDDWIDHIAGEHGYLAWMDGQTPIDFQKDEEVYKHLSSICKLVNGFKCPRCDIVRKYVKTYMQHIKECKTINKDTVLSAIKNNELLECAICHEHINPKEWQQHAMEKHYNIAWVVGEPDVDLNNPYAVASLLKDYHQKYHKFTCKVCGINRVSSIGFYAHILACGKSPEEVEPFKQECEICNNKYLRIYKSQHMTAHREFELTKERRQVAAEKEKKKNESVEPISGRRRAAEKANSVLEKYKSNKNENEGSHCCPTCSFSTEVESELSEHVCAEEAGKDFSDSDESVDMDQWSDDESADTDIDSNLSDEELASKDLGAKKKRHGESSSAAAKIQRTPFSVENPRSYLKQCGKEYIETYWSKEDLFMQWRRCEFEVLNEDQKAHYLPPIAESCKIRLPENNKDSNKPTWTTYKRYEARKSKICSSVFVGANVRCIAWAPPPLARESPAGERQYLAAACHLAADEPRHAWADTPTGPSLIQIWDYGDMRVVPQFAFGIALDYGAVWAMDWCPSGTRDAPELQDTTTPRLGLLATACSNGYVYILSVPYPSTITENDEQYYKLKPVVQLRLAMSVERQVYQATSLKWSPQKGHGHILVGYSDGTIAYYDLNIESPILKTTENNVTIIYPYYDEKFLNACIEGVDLYPTGGGAGAAGAAGAACGASAAGGRLARAGAGAGGARRSHRLSHLAAARAAFLPHWPAAMLVGDDVLLSTSVNELSWWGAGRRFGGARAAAGCPRCGRAALAAHRQLRLLSAHPHHADLHKLVVGVIEMVPFNDRRKRKVNDDLSMVVEPTSYEDAIKKYGLEYQFITKADKASQLKVSSVVRQPYPERFPLAEMTSLAFCGSEQHHDKLAVAVHAGFMFVVSL